VSRTLSSLILCVLMMVLAIYMFAFPPDGWRGFPLRLAMPFALMASALSVLENLRTRTHITQLVAAMMGKSGHTPSDVPPTPEVRGEAVEILLQSLKSEKEKVRKVAARQLENLTGKSFGEDVEAWERWWGENKGGSKDRGG